MLVCLDLTIDIDLDLEFNLDLDLSFTSIYTMTYIGILALNSL